MRFAHEFDRERLTPLATGGYDQRTGRITQLVRVRSLQGRSRRFESCCAHLNIRTFIAKTRETRVFLGGYRGSRCLLRIAANTRGRLLLRFVLRILQRFFRAFNGLANVLSSDLEIMGFGNRLRVPNPLTNRLDRKPVR